MRRVLLDSVPSTNDYALALVDREMPAEGTVVQARAQTRGKGQTGSLWWSEPGKNLTVSFILYPTFLDPDHQFLLTQAVSVAVADTVRALAPGAAVALKWPNDVLLERRKVAGILIESRLRAGRMHTAVAGVGLNVNQKDFPAELATAGSLRAVVGRDLDLEDTLASLARSLDRWYQALREDPPRVRTAYTAALHGLGQLLSFHTPGGELRATLRGVDPRGRLRATLEDGTERLFAPREASLRLA